MYKVTSITCFGRLPNTPIMNLAVLNPSRTAEESTTTCLVKNADGSYFTQKRFSLMTKGNTTKYENVTAALVQCLDHKNIVKMYNYFSKYRKIQYGGAGETIEETGFIWLEPYKFDLDSIIYRPFEEKKRVLKEDGTLTCAIQMAEGMAYVHSKNYIHNDLNPASIWFTSKDKLVISGFEHSQNILCRDISKERRRSNSGKYEDVFSGKLTYLAPELLKTSWFLLEQPKKVDIYSFGVILMEMLSTKVPFEGYGKNVFRFSEIKHRGISQLDFDSLKSYINKDFVNLIKWCTVNDPTKRIASFEEILKILNDIKLVTKKSVFFLKMDDKVNNQVVSKEGTTRKARTRARDSSWLKKLLKRIKFCL